jgi:16S rRNA (uracil1498-N3)-methyltransferase
MPHQEVYYTPPELIDSNAGVLKIQGQEAHHIRNVVRHISCDKIIVVDGCGKAYWVTLLIGHQEIITGAIEKEESGWGESKMNIGVIIPPLKGHRMDTVIEKGTELGVCSFCISNTENTVARVGASKLDRWHRIALSAMKQCCRSVCPVILQFLNLEESLKASTQSETIVLFADMGKPKLNRSMLPTSFFRKDSKASVAVAVGPEGGFSDEEIALLNNCGGIPFGLGPRRLRSDTAVMAALAQIILLSGEDTT